MVNVTRTSSASWWLQVRYVTPITFLLAILFVSVSRAYLLEEIISDNFIVQCQPEALDGKSELIVTVDGETYFGTKRHSNCEQLREIGAAEIRLLLRKGERSIRGLYLDGHAIQSELESAFSAGLGLFLIIWLFWLATIKFINRLGKRDN